MLIHFTLFESSSENWISLGSNQKNELLRSEIVAILNLYFLVRNGSMKKKALVMAPHPDDAEFFAGGLIASLIEAGTEVTIITATDGCCGSYNENSF